MKVSARGKRASASPGFEYEGNILLTEKARGKLLEGALDKDRIMDQNHPDLNSCFEYADGFKPTNHRKPRNAQRENDEEIWLKYGYMKQDEKLLNDMLASINCHVEANKSDIYDDLALIKSYWECDMETFRRLEKERAQGKEYSTNSDDSEDSDDDGDDYDEDMKNESDDRNGTEDSTNELKVAKDDSTSRISRRRASFNKGTPECAKYGLLDKSSTKKGRDPGRGIVTRRRMDALVEDSFMELYNDMENDMQKSRRLSISSEKAFRAKSSSPSNASTRAESQSRKLSGGRKRKMDFSNVTTVTPNDNGRQTKTRKIS